MTSWVSCEKLKRNLHDKKKSFTGFSDENLDDGLPRTILNYANGQSFDEHFEVTVAGEVSRVDLAKLFGGERPSVIAI